MHICLVGTTLCVLAKLLIGTFSLSVLFLLLLLLHDLHFAEYMPVYYTCICLIVILWLCGYHKVNHKVKVNHKANIVAHTPGMTVKVKPLITLDNKNKISCTQKLCIEKIRENFLLNHPLLATCARNFRVFAAIMMVVTLILNTQLCTAIRIFPNFEGS